MVERKSVYIISDSPARKEKVVIENRQFYCIYLICWRAIKQSDDIIQVTNNQLTIINNNSHLGGILWSAGTQEKLHLLI